MPRKHRFSFLSFLSSFCLGVVENGGGKPAPTVPELTQKISDLEGQNTKLLGERDLAVTRAETAEGQVTTLTKDKTELQTKLTTAEGQVTTLQGKVTDLEKNQKNAEQIAREETARHGAAPSGKSAEVVQNAGKDAGELWETYMAADATEQARMRAADKDDALQKSAKAFDARSKK